MQENLTVSKLMLEGLVTLEHFRGGELIHREVGKNIITTEGLNHALNVVLGAVAKNATWYCGIFKGNVTPAAGDTAATALGAVGSYTECQDADYGTPATNRPEWTDAPASGGVISNAAAKASFTIAASLTLYGAFLASSQPKTATTGVLFAAKRFDSARPVIANDVIQIGYTITGTSS